MYRRTIVCLANSVKHGARCVAGKGTELDYSGWLRPVSNAPKRSSLSAWETRFKNGQQPKPLDIITIPLAKPVPKGHQQENHLIDTAHSWAKQGKLAWEDLPRFADEADALWINGCSSNNGLNDRVPACKANRLTNSLLLIQPDTLTLRVGLESSADGKKGNPKVRAMFSFKGHKYRLAVTDPDITKTNGEYSAPASEVYMCLSLGGHFHGHCYKLVASILSKRPLGIHCK